MRILYFAVFTTLVCGCLMTAAYASDGDRQQDVATLTEKKVFVWRRLYAERDADGLADFLADGFQVLEPDGSVRTKDEEVRWLRETPPDEDTSDFLFTIEEIVFAADNIAIVYGHGDSTRATDDGRPCHHNYWSSNTFVLQDGEWKPIFSHISGITCTPLESLPFHGEPVREAPLSASPRRRFLSNQNRGPPPGRHRFLCHRHFETCPPRPGSTAPSAQHPQRRPANCRDRRNCDRSTGESDRRSPDLGRRSAGSSRRRRCGTVLRSRPRRCSRNGRLWPRDPLSGHR